MNPRVLTGFAGLLITALGAAALVDPNMMIGLLQYSIPSDAARAAVLGEFRATYGGVFLVMGLFTLLAAIDPTANRGRITFVAAMWLGACAGRLFGVSVDGNPGLRGWLSAGFELALGAILLLGAWLPGDIEEAPPTTRPMSPSTPGNLPPSTPVASPVPRSTNPPA